MSLPDVFTIEEVAKWLKVPRAVVYEEIKAGRLRAVRIGEEWRIPDTALRGLFEEPSKEAAPAVLTVSMSAAPEFDYQWPTGEPEHFYNVREGELVEGEKHISVKAGECVRDAYGRERKRIVVFFDDYPNAEFVETDKPPDHYYTFLPGNPDPRKHLRPDDNIDPQWRMFTIREHKEVVTGPRTGSGLVIVVPQNDIESMVRFTRLKAHKRWGW